MSRVPIWCELVCRTCANTLMGQFSFGAIPRAELKREGRNAGVLFKHDEVFCDADCLGRFERQQTGKIGAVW